MRLPSILCRFVSAFMRVRGMFVLPPRGLLVLALRLFILVPMFMLGLAVLMRLLSVLMRTRHTLSLRNRKRLLLSAIGCTRGKGEQERKVRNLGLGYHQDTLQYTDAGAVTPAEYDCRQHSP